MFYPVLDIHLTSERTYQKSFQLSAISILKPHRLPSKHLFPYYYTYRSLFFHDNFYVGLFLQKIYPDISIFFFSSKTISTGIMLFLDQQAFLATQFLHPHHIPKLHQVQQHMRHPLHIKICLIIWVKSQYTLINPYCTTKKSTTC